MGLFDRFKKQQQKPPAEPRQESCPKPPVADTSCLLLMDRVLEDIKPVIEHLRTVFGPQAVSNVDYSHPHVPAFTVTVDGLEFWCSYLSMPVPHDEVDISLVAKYSLFLSPTEREEFSAHRSFWLLAQKGDGTTLEQKRRVCWTFSLLCSVMLEQKGAIGVSVVNSHLLVSKAAYLFHRGNMEGKTWKDPAYFPVPLWVWLFLSSSEDKTTVETWGLKEFGLPELGFFDPELPIQDILNYLYTMSCFQITGQQLYQNAALIPLTSEVEVVCKQDGEKLYFIGG